MQNEKEIFDYSKLKGRIIEKFGTQTAFLNNINMSEVTFIKSIKGERAFNQNEIVNIMNLLDLELSDIVSYFFTNKVRKT